MEEATKNNPEPEQEAMVVKMVRSIEEAERETKKVLASLDEAKEKLRKEIALRNVVPQAFKCPISHQLMKEPVIMANGQTCDRRFIQRFFIQGFQICPKTQEVLDSTTLIPNFLVQEMIEEWCQNCGVEIPEPDQDGSLDVPTHAGKDYLNRLIKKISSSSLENQKEAAKAFRAITEKSSPFCALFSESAADTILKLLSPLSSYLDDSHHDLEEDSELVEDLDLIEDLDPKEDSELVEDVITTLRNVSMHPNNKILVGKTPLAIDLLVWSLNSQNTATRSNAATALFTLSEVESNKLIIGESGALDSLMNLLQDRYPSVMMIAASAIFEICTVPENIERAVDTAVVGIILQHILDGVMVSVFLKLLALLINSTRAIEDIAGFIGLRNLIKSGKNIESKLDKEIWVGILYKVCSTASRRTLEVFKEEEEEEEEEEETQGTFFNIFMSVSDEFSEKTKRDAAGIIKILTGLRRPTGPEIQPA